MVKKRLGLKYHMEFDKETHTFTLTNIRTDATTTFSSIQDLLEFTLKKSCTVYFYELSKIEAAIANIILKDGYTEKLGHEIKGGILGEIGSKEFVIIGSNRPKRTVSIRIRKTKNIQARFLNESEIFGNDASIKEISARLGYKNTKIGMSKALLRLEADGETSLTATKIGLKDMKERCFGRKENGKIIFHEDDFSGNGKGKSKKVGLCPKLDDEHHDFVIKNVQGGLCMYNPEYLGRTDVEGTAYDVNSMYPSIFLQEYLPYGLPTEFEGRFVGNKKTMYFQKVRISVLRLKSDGIAWLKNKEHDNFVNSDQDEYITKASNIELVLNSVDMQMLFENYFVLGIEYLGGITFGGKKGKFDPYINYWMEVKIQAKKDGDMYLYYKAKKRLNSLYGSFISKNDRIISKYVNNNTLVKDKSKQKFIKTELDMNGKREGNSTYAPVGCYVLSYARQRLIKAIKEQGNNFIYCDTDSIYVKGEAKGLEIDEFEAGKWKEEFKFDSINILGKKSYCVRKENGIKTVLAGVEESAKDEQIKTYDDFHIGKVLEFSVDKFLDDGTYFVNKNGKHELKLKGGR